METSWVVSAGLVGAALCAAAFAAPAAGQSAAEVERTVALSAGEAFEKGMEAAGLRHDYKGGVVLYDASLIDDDGVAGGGGNPTWTDEAERSPDVVADARTQLKKILVVDRPEAAEAVLYVRPGRAELLFNGQLVSTRGSDKYFRIPPELVRKGQNEVIVRVPAESNATAGIKLLLRRQILENAPELKDKPPRSFQSTDGGRTWQPLDGELTVRLHLTQYAAEGSFASPVIDLADDNPSLTPLRGAEVRGVRIVADADEPTGTKIRWLARSGASPVYDRDTWTDWAAPQSLKPQGHRFLQWKAVLSTSNPKVTPTLRKITLEAKVAPAPLPAWAGKLAVAASRNAEIRYTSMPFAYEDPNHPKMRLLREKYRLDEVVKDGRTEMEKFVLLRNWVGQQWKFKGPEGHYPAWDADEILTRKTGMCCQYAMTLIQCAIALGHQARYVCGYHSGLGANMGTAHEVTEIWSNQYGKWVFLDPTPAANEHAADPRTGEPLSMLELHDRMIRHYYGDKPATYANRPREPKWSADIALVRGMDANMQIHAESDPPAKNRSGQAQWPSWTKWRMLCWVPRNDWYARPTPLPRLQGWNNWDWTGFWQWADDRVERDPRYAFFTNRRSDVEWTINQVRFAVAATEKPGALAVRMGTVTPFFQAFLVNVDGAGWKPVAGATFDWQLKPGKNRLEMRARNTSGVEGPVSFLEITNP